MDTQASHKMLKIHKYNLNSFKMVFKINNE